MTFYIIGSGNMAWFLTGRLLAAGYSCKGIWARNAVAAQKLADAYSVAVCNDLTDIKDDADYCLLAVADTALEEVASQLTLRHTLLVHTAGAAAIDILSRSAMQYGAAWPVYSIVKDDLPQHRDVPIAYEASSPEASKKLEMLVHALTDMGYEANIEQRRWLHLCAVLSNNFTNHLMTIAAELCSKNDIPFSLLQPIIIQTATRITDHSPQSLQTGPARRGDVATQQKHIDILEPYPDWQRVYEALNASIKAMYGTDNQTKG